MFLKNVFAATSIYTVNAYPHIIHSMGANWLFSGSLDS